MKLDRKGSSSHLLSQLDGLNRLCGLCVLHSAHLSDGDITLTPQCYEDSAGLFLPSRHRSCDAQGLGQWWARLPNPQSSVQACAAPSDALPPGQALALTVTFGIGMWGSEQLCLLTLYIA